MDVCIKNIDEDDWSKFRIESIKHKTPMGKLLGKLIKEHEMIEKTKKGNAKEILFGKKHLKGFLTRDEFRKIREEFRKDFESEFN